jgi:hypothetical protein
LYANKFRRTVAEDIQERYKRGTFLGISSSSFVISAIVVNIPLHIAAHMFCLEKLKYYGMVFSINNIGIMRARIKIALILLFGEILKVYIPQLSLKLVWIISGFLFIVGLVVALHAIKTFHDAEVVVEWATASELDTAGFNLLRGEGSTGPYEQVNSELIPSSSDALTGGSYRYNDNHLKAGETYYYVLEEIEINGNSNQHGPIIVEATRPARTELIIAVLLISGAVLFGVLFLRSPNQPDSTTDLK